MSASIVLLGAARLRWKLGFPGAKLVEILRVFLLVRDPIRISDIRAGLIRVIQPLEIPPPRFHNLVQKLRWISRAFLIEEEYPSSRGVEPHVPNRPNPSAQRCGQCPESYPKQIAQRHGTFREVCMATEYKK